MSENYTQASDLMRRLVEVAKEEIPYFHAAHRCAPLRFAPPRIATRRYAPRRVAAQRNATFF